MRDPEFPGLVPAGVSKVVIAGCEAHVCVQQTVADLLQARREVFLVADAVGSRSADDKRTALERARQHGAQVVTSEMVLFEWPGDSRHPSFRDVQKLLLAIPRDVTIVMIEHDMDVALEFAEQITLLHFGEVIVEGSRTQVVADPRTREVYLGH